MKSTFVTIVMFGCVGNGGKQTPTMMEALASYCAQQLHAHLPDSKVVTVESRIDHQTTNDFSVALKRLGVPNVIRKPPPDFPQPGFRLVLRRMSVIKNSATIELVILFDVMNGRVERINLQRTSLGWSVTSSSTVGDI